MTHDLSGVVMMLVDGLVIVGKVVDDPHRVVRIVTLDHPALYRKDVFLTAAGVANIDSFQFLPVKSIDIDMDKVTCASRVTDAQAERAYLGARAQANGITLPKK